MEWINVVLTVLSLGGGFVAWWMANQSKRAKKESEIALYNAREELKAMRDQAEALRELAMQGRGPELEASYDRGDTWLLTNNSDGEVVIEEVTNAEDEGIYEAGRLSGMRIAPRGSAPFMCMPIALDNQQHVLAVKVQGRDEQVFVPYPPKPRRR